ncbi:MAG: ABC transporter permease [Bacteroidales bacterium]|nr:ABC transporter permease [Bacteroidales bacterium]
MLLNYIKTAYRNMMRNFSQTLINVLGLAIGMACTLLIFLWVQNQLNYDKWQEKKDRIFRLETETWVIMPPYIGDLIKEMPEVEEMVRFYLWHQPSIKYKDKRYNNIKNFAYADSSILNIFNFNFLNGNSKSALSNPFSIILTESISNKIFGKDNPIGKVIIIDEDESYTVTGVIEDVKNLHLEINAIVSVQDIARLTGNNHFLESRGHNFLIYLLLRPNVDKDFMTQKIREIDFDEQQDDHEEALLIRPFKEIYFTRGLPHENFVKHGNFNLVLIFSTISILILIIACINFINITTAKANLRIKEIAIRKIVGAERKEIANQFLGETFFLVLIAHIICIVILEFILPKFNLITNESISFSYLSPQFIITVITIIFITTFLSGIYPSLYLSSLKPVLMLKNKSGGQKQKGNLRKTLMITQFVISIFLIITTLIILKQLDYVLNKDFGWNKENLVTFQLEGSNFNESDENEESVINNKIAFRAELLKNPQIINVSFLNQFPGNITNTWSWNIDEERYEMRMISADPELINTLGIELIAGRNFSYDFPSDKDVKVLINETGANLFKQVDPVGSYLDKERGYKIIGVVKDFNFNSLHSKIVPVTIRWMDNFTSSVCIKISNNNIPETINYINSIYNKFCPNYPFEYSFMDDRFAKQYDIEMKQAKILIFFACIAIFIAGLGLFGMSSFISATRTKEIGIRKALGSSTSEIMILFSGSFIRWILIAFVITSPLAYYLVKKWLMQYPYQTSIDWWVFIAALVITILVAIITTGYQVIKSARTNPAECLRYE